MTAPKPLPSQCYIEHLSRNIPSASKRTGFPWLIFAAWVLIAMLITGGFMILATHVTERTAATVKAAHVKAMY